MISIKKHGGKGGGDIRLFNNASSPLKLMCPSTKIAKMNDIQLKAWRPGGGDIRLFNNASSPLKLMVSL